eukprot:gene2601-30998_t
MAMDTIRLFCLCTQRKLIKGLLLKWWQEHLRFSLFCQTISVSFQGSVLELKKVGVAEVDVDVTHRLRANFDSRISQQGTNLVLELTGAGTNDQKYMGNGISSAAEVNNQNLVSSSHAGAMTNKQP